MSNILSMIGVELNRRFLNIDDHNPEGRTALMIRFNLKNGKSIKFLPNNGAVLTLLCTLRDSCFLSFNPLLNDAVRCAKEDFTISES